jgi:diaminohydroxyphosphoribosylaminopyrimidine deaminase/5-amino-6-(5-phosphoribosylamino)uracil reductase
MTDESLMKLALRLAAKGRGHVSPNPLVGSVIEKDGKIIAQGYHQFFGKEHAEVLALDSAGADAIDGTLYVNLEPCGHFGKQPPCVDLILAAGIKRVVVGTLDPNPLVCGKGIQKLREHGIEVKVGVLEDLCRDLNEPFLKHIVTGLPLTTLKIAQTVDGRIAINGESKWITGERSRGLVHKMRSQHDAVLTGIGTVLADDPQLTVRLTRGASPRRLVVDSRLRIPLHSRVLTDEFAGRTIVATTTRAPKNKIGKIEKLGAKVWVVKADSEKRVHLPTLWRRMGKAGIASVLVEGGNRVASAVLKNKLVDKIHIFVAPKILGDGLSAIENLGINSLARAIQLDDFKSKKVDGDLLMTARLAQN